MNIRNLLYTGILLVSSAVVSLTSGGCSSTRFSSIDGIVLDNLNPKNTIAQEESKQEEDCTPDALDTLIRLEIDYQKGRRHKTPYGKTKGVIDHNDEDGFYISDINNNLIPLTQSEKDNVMNIMNSIKTLSYNEFTGRLSQMNEREITATLALLAGLVDLFVYKKNGDVDYLHFPDVDAEQMYNLIKNSFIEWEPIYEDVACAHTHNLISETARRAGMPEAIVFTCETNKQKHAASAIWWPDGTIKIIDNGDIYSGSSDLEILFREFQRKQGVLAITHGIYINKKHRFTFTTTDGKLFYKAINYAEDTTNLKNILTDKTAEKPLLEVRIGNTENSFCCSKNSFFLKMGHIRGADEPVYWDAPFIQFGKCSEGLNENDTLTYDVSLLAVPIKNHTIAGASGSITYKKKTNLTPSDTLTFAAQLASLVDFAALVKKNTLLNENECLTLKLGACYTNTFNNETKTDIYTLMKAEPVIGNIIKGGIATKPIISKFRTGAKITFMNGFINNWFINPEFLYENQSDTLSLATGWSYDLGQGKKLEFGFTLSDSKTRYKYIWPDRNSLNLSATYSTNSISVGGSLECSRKKWILDEKYDFRIKLEIGLRF